jgi:hypothetical protein
MLDRIAGGKFRRGVVFLLELGDGVESMKTWKKEKMMWEYKKSRADRTWMLTRTP